MIKDDWIVTNWAFLSARPLREIQANRAANILRQPDAPTSGRFYGTEQFFNGTSLIGTIGHRGNRKLSLRPYIVAPMPEERVKAIYIDPKKYRFNEEGKITGLDSLYEVPIYTFIQE